MTREELHAVVLQKLGDIAPEAPIDTLNPDADVRDELDIDSMDFLNFIIGLNATLHVDIPEADYPKLRTVNAAVDYLMAKMPA